MSEWEQQQGVRNGWHWRFVSLVVLGIVVVQLVADQAIHYQILTTGPLAVLIASYLIIPRAKQRKLGNAIAGFIAVFVLDIILELAVDDRHVTWTFHTLRSYVSWNLYTLVLGLAVSIGYLKLTQWSDRKRAESEARKRDKAAAPGRVTQATAPIRRHHSKKGRKKR